MGFLSRIKAAFSPAKYLGSSVRVYEGYGHKGSKPRPFDARKALAIFSHWAYAAATLNANAAAGVPKRLYAREGSTAAKKYRTRPMTKRARRFIEGQSESQPTRMVAAKALAFGGDMVEVIEHHPIMSVMQTVNPWQNGYELDVLKFIDLQSAGNHYQHPIINIGGVPHEIWRMRPDWVRVQPSTTQFIRGYVYGQGMDIEQEFRPDEVIQWKMPNPRDLHYGMGWFEAGWTAIGLHGAKREMDMAKADNYARPDWLLSIKNGASPDTLDRLEGKVNEKFRGTNKAGKFLVAGGDVSAVALNFDEKEWGTGTRIIEEIAAVSGVPVAMLLSNDPNRANSEASRLGWYRNTIRPYCRLDEEKLNERWIPLFNDADDLFIAYDPVCFEDEQAKAKQLVGYVAGGILTPNEARADIGYPDSDDEAANVLYPPVGGAGVSATAEDNAPGQNNSRRNEDPGTN